MYNNAALPTQSAQNSIQVTRFELLETGSYNPMYSRPYEMVVQGDTLNSLSDRVLQNAGNSISPSLLTGLASTIMKPSVDHQHEIPIHHGWNERRLRFILYVDVKNSIGTVSTYVFQGFTNFLGVSMQGSIDPNMLFVINSFVRLNYRQVQTQYGVTNESVVTESYHVVNGQIIQDPNHDNSFAMRPMDVFTGIQSNFIGNAYASYGEGKLIDTRTTINGDSISSKRANCLPGNYLSNVINSYQTAKDLAGFGVNEEDIFGRSKELSFEASPSENPFIRMLGRVRGFAAATCFTMRDLESIDPSVSHVTNYRVLGQTARQSLHSAGQTAYWHGKDNETLWATMLSNAVPAVMMELMIGQIGFYSTNDAMGGVITTQIGEMVGLSNANMTRHMQTFIHRLEREILADMAYFGHVFHINVRCNIYGESQIDIKLDSGEMYRYTTPSYCDGLFVPVYTSDTNTYCDMVNNFESLMNSLPQTGSMAVNASI